MIFRARSRAGCRKERRPPARTLPLVLVACLVAPAAVAQQVVPPDAPYRDATLPVEDRVEDLLGRMTLEEKVAQMVSLWQSKATFTDSATGDFDPRSASPWFRTGVGRIERTSEGHDARGHAEYNNAIQRWVRDSTRLGIPMLFHEEALHGLVGEQATSFPQAIALASTWNPELVERVFRTTAAEARARGTHQVLAPVVDIVRDPRWGRFEETYGEDPFLTARLGVAAVRGFQGRGSTIGARSVLATLKHMTGHGQPESGTNVGPASPGERTLRDDFLHPFEVAIQQGGARSVMPSYNELDGVPSHVNAWMLRDVLRGEWGFDGTIVSDWFAIRELLTRHSLAESVEEAARRALRAGVDLELPEVDGYGTLVEQVRSGAVAEAELDAALRRLLRPKFELGLFENPFVDPDTADAVSGSADARGLALEAARQALILLKNDDGALPLRQEGLSRVAVIGPHASEVLTGGYSGVPRTSVSILEGLRTRLDAGATVSYAEGVRLTEDSVFTPEPQPHEGGVRSGARWGADLVVQPDATSDEARMTEAETLARSSDLVVLVLGDNEMTAREAYAENHLGDRASLDLPGRQGELARRVVETGTKVVLVLIHGRPLAIPDLVASVPAVLDGWYLGQETGTAVAEALFGDTNPGGKLTVTVPRSVGQVPVFYDHKPSARRGYVLDTTAPLFPFGFGLSYTTFAYANLAVTPSSVEPAGRVRVTVDVTNTGARAGDEVVQLYVRDQVSRATRPVKELRGFERITLEPGERRTVTFDLGPEHLWYHGPDMRRTVEPGAFDVLVGGSSVDLLSAPLTVVPVGAGYQQP
jgi:beta-glucosidase